jgi:hypothetical protein
MPERGEHLAPLPGDAFVLRLAASSTRRFTADAFKLNSPDKAELPWRSSVWDADQTTPEQAFDLMSRNPDYRIVGYLQVARIRALQADGVDVVWDHDDRPGAGGHSGITQPAGEGKQAKQQRERLRRQLADLANEDPRTGVFRDSA